jgi:hypothetical protein
MQREHRDVVQGVRLSNGERAAVAKAAQTERISLSAFMRREAMRAAAGKTTRRARTMSRPGCQVAARLQHRARLAARGRQRTRRIDAALLAECPESASVPCSPTLGPRGGEAPCGEVAVQADERTRGRFLQCGRPAEGPFSGTEEECRPPLRFGR